MANPGTSIDTSMMLTIAALPRTFVRSTSHAIGNAKKNATAVAIAASSTELTTMRTTVGRQEAGVVAGRREALHHEDREQAKDQRRADRNQYARRDDE